MPARRSGQSFSYPVTTGWAVFHLKQALSAEFLKELAESTARGLGRRDCFYDQFHYVNRRFVEEHFEKLAGLVVAAVSDVRPGVTTRDLTYVNDFVAPVNLANAQIHTRVKGNKYDWHNDGIDRTVRPCYNLWIPLYRQSALGALDDQSLFDVLTPASCPRLYDADGELRQGVLWRTKAPSSLNREIASKLVDVPLDELDDYMYFHGGGKTEKIPLDELTPVSVVRPRLGDCYVFDSSYLHASGPSTFERVGISIKFLLNNPALGFRAMPQGAVPGGWLGMFVCWYGKQGGFSAYQEVLDMYIKHEQPLLQANADKLDCVRSVLLQVSSELGGNSPA